MPGSKYEDIGSNNSLQGPFARRNDALSASTASPRALKVRVLGAYILGVRAPNIAQSLSILYKGIYVHIYI